jgi:hypothetical protein
MCVLEPDDGHTGLKHVVRKKTVNCECVKVTGKYQQESRCNCQQASLQYESHMTPCGRVLLEKPSRSAGQEIPCFLRNQKVQNLLHKSPPPVPILSQINPIQSPHPISLRSILILSYNKLLGLPSCLLPSAFPTKILYACFISNRSAICQAHLIIVNLIILVFGETCKLWSSSLCSFAHLPATSSLFGLSNIQENIPHRSYKLILMIRRKFVVLCSQNELQSGQNSVSAGRAVKKYYHSYY